MHTTLEEETHEFEYKGRRFIIITQVYQDKQGTCYAFDIPDPDFSDIGYKSRDSALEAAKRRIRRHYKK